VRRRKVLELFDKPGGDVLDVGCGPGVMAQALITRGCRFWGVDPSSRMLEIARRRVGQSRQIRFLQGDAMRLGFADDSFDAVLCIGVIDAVADRRQAVREMVRVLKPRGTLLLTFTNLVSPYAWWKNYVFYPAVSVCHRLRLVVGRPCPRSGRLRDGRLRGLYRRKDAEALVESERAEVLQIVSYYYNAFISPLDELVPGIALRATQRLEEGAWTPPNWLAAGYILKAKKR